MTLHVPQHKLQQTLREAISFDQLRREAAYQEYLAAKEKFQQDAGRRTAHPLKGAVS